MKLFSLVLLLLAGLLQTAGTVATAATKAVSRNSAKKAAAKKKPTTTAARKTVAAKTSASKKATPRKAVAASKPAAGKKTARKAPVRRRIKAAPPVDPTEGDNVDGEDLTVRRAAVAALGTLNGAVVAVDPTNGRVLSIVNQKLALRSGFVPCSTIKLVTALAALNEGVIDRETTVRLSRRAQFDLTLALAKSNNPFFEKLGNQLGYDRVTYYARMLGLGEKAGLNIPGEEAGLWPAVAPGGGVGKMTAYGQDILMTPLELAALVSAIANGGDLYYLQYPRSDSEQEAFEPQLKRRLDFPQTRLEDVKVGMRAAVEVGTARRADYETSEPILGKTGTCTDFRASSHMGWFGSFIEVDHHPLVVVVMLMGTKTVNGPVASGIAGAIYRNLSQQQYFVADAKPADLLGTGSCCTR
jgi:cell division protein FtsI/penicillin-binding protein 2